MKKKYIIGSVAVIALSLCSYELGRYQGATKTESRRVAYVEEVTNSKEQTQANVEELTPEQISAKENNSAEQIVIKITDQGYVTSHGDHFHYYNGKVPYDAIISEELLMLDPEYQLKDSDIVNEVKDGYIIKVNGHYYLYLKNKEHPTNVRSKEEIAQQRNRHSQAKTKRLLEEEGATAKQGERYTTDDGYIFNPRDIIEDTGDAYIVPHGNHFHYIPKSDLSPDELRAAQTYWNGRNQTLIAYPNTPPIPQNPGPIYQLPHVSEQASASSNRPLLSKPKQPAKPIVQPTQSSAEEVIRLLKELYALPLSQRYVEEDGLVFDPTQLTNRTVYGVVVPHGNHYHFIPYHKLSELEQKIAKMIPIGAHFPGLTAPKGGGTMHAPKDSDSTKADQVGSAQTSDTISTTPWKEADGSRTPLLPPKKDVSAEDKEFYQASYQLIETAASSLDQQKANRAAYDTLNQFVRELNEGARSKVDLARAILAHTSLIQHPERQGKTNAQIVYTAQELQVARLAGLYTTSDGYIFDAKDITSDEGDGYLAPHMDHSHYIPKTDLSALEQEEAQRHVTEAGLGDKEKDVTPPTTGEKAIDIYERVEPAKIIPVAEMPYRAAYAVDMKNERIIIPHHNHYHNIPLYLFDTGLYQAPEGYTLEQFLATVKYYVLHPEDRPESEDGYGISSDHGKSKEDSAQDEEGNYNPDAYEREQQRLADEYGIPMKEFQEKLLTISGKYNLSIENFSYQPEQKTLSFTRESGQTVIFSLETMAEV